jgi:hypothetical protein
MTCKINADTSDGLKIVSDTSGEVDIQANGATKIHMASDGKVGIGTSSPDKTLTVEAASDNIFLKQTSGDHGYILDQDNGDGSFSFKRRDSGTDTERVKFSNDGKVYFNGSTSVATSQTSWRWDISGINYQSRTSAGTIQQFRNGGTAVGSISVAASSTAFNTSSDYRLKENVTYTWDATTRLKQLKPARFNFIADDTNTLVDGFIAHEVSSIVPEAITGTQDAVDEDGNPDYQGIDQSKLVPLLVKTIQELEARITALESE